MERYGEALSLVGWVYKAYSQFWPKDPGTPYCEWLFNELVNDIEKKIPILVDKGRGREAEEIYMSSLKSLEASLGRSNDRALRFTSNYGIVLGETVQHAQALPLRERAYMSSLELFGPHHAHALRRKRRLDCSVDVTKEKNIDIAPKKEEEGKKTELVVLEGSDM
jgi:hypothetical protein